MTLEIFAFNEQAIKEAKKSIEKVVDDQTEKKTIDNDKKLKSQQVIKVYIYPESPLTYLICTNMYKNGYFAFNEYQTFIHTYCSYFILKSSAVDYIVN